VAALKMDFLGKGWSFPPSFSSEKGAVDMVEGVNDVHESLWILLSTEPGERIMNPHYGCRLKSLVFETINSNTIVKIQRTVEQAILYFEPRIIVNRVNIDTEQSLEGLMKIEVDYTIRTTNTRHNLVYPYYLLEGTNVSL